MSSLYIRKPRNVRSVYARPLTLEDTEPAGADLDKPVCQNGSKLIEKSSKLESGGESAEADRNNRKQSVRDRTDSGVDQSPGQMECSGGRKSKRGHADGLSTMVESCVNEGPFPSTKSKRGKVGRPAKAVKNSVNRKSAALSLPNVHAVDKSGSKDKKVSSVFSKSKVDEASIPSESHCGKETFVTSNTLNLLKRKIKENKEIPKEAIKPDPDANDMSITKLKPYVCTICQRRYGSDIGLREHELVHQGEAIGDCSVQLQEGAEPYKQFECDICNKAFRFKSSLKKHRLIHSEVKPFVCDICGKGFSQEKNLKIHQFRHTGERPFMCDLCNKSFLRNFDLQQHKRIHTGERPYACNVCGKGFIKMDYLKHHRQIHQVEEGSKPFKCDQCPKSFKRSLALRAHKQRHVGLKLFECEVCRKKFSTRSVLKKHTRIHTRSPVRKKEPVSVQERAEKERCVCDICGATICKKSAFKIHMKTHTGERPFVCEFCNKGYITKNEWLIHVRSHTGERPFACHICPAAYARNESLIRHIKGYHYDDRPYVCETCNRAFKDPRHLKDHKLIHLGLKPHKCSHCGKSFTQAGSLRSHVRTHTGEKPYACMYCSKRFADTGSRIRHVRIHTGEKPYKCSQCHAVFARPEPFKHHRETVHGDFTTVPLNIVRKPPVRAALPSSSSVVVHQGGNCQDTVSYASGSCSHSTGNMTSEPVVAVPPPDIAVSKQTSRTSANQVMVVQPVETYVSNPVTDILSGPTIVVESTHVQDSEPNNTVSGQTSGKKKHVNLSDTSVVHDMLPSNHSHSQNSSSSETIECAVVEHPDNGEVQLMHEEQDTSSSVVSEAQADNKDMVPTVIEVQVRHSGKGMPQRVIEVKYDGSVAQSVVQSVVESEPETEQEDCFPGSAADDFEIEKEDFKVEYVENEQVQIEYARNKTTLEDTESQAGTHNAGNVVVSESGNVSDDAQNGTAIADTGSQIIFGYARNASATEKSTPGADESEKTSFLAVSEFQDSSSDADNATGLLVIESKVDSQDAGTAALAVLGSQTDSYCLENARTITVLESEAGSRCPPNYCQVYQADETGSVTIIKSQTIFENNQSSSPGNQSHADHMENTSGSRIIDLKGVGTIEIIMSDTVASGNGTDNNDSSVKDEKPLLESLDREEKYQPPMPVNTNKRFNRKNKPTTMKMDASVFGDTIKTRKRSAYGKRKRDWICEVCGKGFTVKSALKSHLAVIHKVNEDRRFVCDICNKACVAKNLLEDHRRTHTGERPYTCDVCSNAYKLKSHLRQHILVAHMGKRPYTCEICQKTFTERNSLRDHKLIHEGVRPHKCPTCGKTFTQWGSLSNHKRIHLGVRLMCHYCGKDFSDKSSFMRHQRIHTGERPCKCDHCPAAFARSEQLKRHISKEHPGDLQNLVTLATAVATISEHQESNQLSS